MTHNLNFTKQKRKSQNKQHTAVLTASHTPSSRDSRQGPCATSQYERVLNLDKESVNYQKPIMLNDSLSFIKKVVEHCYILNSSLHYSCDSFMETNDGVLLFEWIANVSE
jgi:hypothetical protein